MYHIAIVEDELNFTTQLQEFLSQYQKRIMWLLKYQPLGMAEKS